MIRSLFFTTFLLILVENSISLICPQQLSSTRTCTTKAHSSAALAVVHTTSSNTYKINFHRQQQQYYHNLPLTQSSMIMRSKNEDRIESDPTGRKRGLILLPIVLLIAIWLFSIPPEFRRARICSEQQVIDNPGSKCITGENWVKGVQEYYRNGGGVEFDFSIDPDN